MPNNSNLASGDSAFKTSATVLPRSGFLACRQACLSAFGSPNRYLCILSKYKLCPTKINTIINIQLYFYVHRFLKKTNKVVIFFSFPSVLGWALAPSGLVRPYAIGVSSAGLRGVGSTCQGSDADLMSIRNAIARSLAMFKQV